MPYNLSTMQSILCNNKEITLIKYNNKTVYQKSSGPDYTEPFYVENITNENETLNIAKSAESAPTLTIEYSTDKSNWDTLVTTSTTVFTKTLAPGEKVYLRCTTNKWVNNTSRNAIFGISKIGGNIMSLLYGSSFTGSEKTFPTTNGYEFGSNIFSNTTTNAQLKDISQLLLPATTMNTRSYYNLFGGCILLTIAPALPATTLANSCYQAMFSRCTSLTTAPALLATTLADSCYSSMFQGCTSLTAAPALLATTLADSCYSSMFQGCTSLTAAPALPATTLTSYCYYSMFNGCISLTTAPVLPATTLADSCYSSMFQGCTSLTTAPVLPATALANYCYESMFQDCTSLTTAPALPATTLAYSCYSSMFQDCTSLTTAPALPATTLADSCYSSMFFGCTSLSNVTCLATSGIDENDSTYEWTAVVSSTGTFTKAAGVTWPTGISGIPEGWTVIEQ